MGTLLRRLGTEIIKYVPINTSSLDDFMTTFKREGAEEIEAESRAMLILGETAFVKHKGKHQYYTELRARAKNGRIIRRREWYKSEREFSRGEAGDLKGLLNMEELLVPMRKELLNVTTNIKQHGTALDYSSYQGKLQTARNRGLTPFELWTHTSH